MEGGQSSSGSVAAQACCAPAASQPRAQARAWLLSIVLLGFVYFVAAKLGLLLAVPTIYASPFWPASGVALAGLLVCGYRAWPGVFIGCLLLNIGTVSLAAAASVAGGASLQALVGAFLVRRFGGFPSALDEGRDIARFMLLAGPLACWISATCGVATLVLVGFMPADDFAFNWWTWWIGDSLGVFVVAPLVLAWTAEPRESWRERRGWVSGAVCLASAVAVAFFIPASRWEQERTRAHFEESSASLGEALRASTSRYLEVLESVRDLHESSTELTWPEFRSFVTGPLARYPGFQAISWNPRIADSARAEEEQKLRRDGHANAGITERNAEGRLVPAARRSEYVFVRYIEPYEDNRPALGYDVASNPARLEALSRARDSGRPVATAQIALVQDARREPAVLAFVPVYRKGAPLDTQAQRRATLLGYMTGVFRVPDMVASSLTDLPQADLELVLRDGSAARTQPALYSSERAAPEDPSTWARLMKAGLAREIGIDFAGRHWVLNVSPTWEYLKTHRSWQSWAALAAGMFISGLIGAFLLLITGRSVRLETLAGRLQSEAAERKLAEEKIRRLNRVYAVLSGINGLLVRVRDREELYREACRIAVEVGALRMAWLGLYDRELMSVTPVAWHGQEDGFLDLMALSIRDPVKEGRGLVRRAIREKRPIIVQDIEHDEVFRLRQEALERGYRSGATVPLRIDGEVIGVLGLFAGEVRFFDGEEMRLLIELAGDISFALEHIRNSEQLEYLANFDPLTGLANGRLFHERLSEHARTVAQAGETFALCVVDVDRFKSINDVCGRQIGDALLKQIAARMVAATGDEARLARISADRFALVMPRVRTGDEVGRRVEQKLKACFGESFNVHDQALAVSAKIGVAMFPADGTGEAGLFANAEAALKKAKATGQRYVFHAPEITARVAEKLALENKLRQALQNGEFVLHYQPKVSTQTRQLEGVEALIRWQSPDRGLVAPGQFIPLLEETGLILDVGAWALRQAASDQRAWADRGVRAPRVAVNVSALQLRQPDFVATLSRALRREGTPAAIDLELTESLLMDDLDGNIGKLKAVRALGMKIAIDDFGTGHSSLAYLARLPVDSLKIDRSFVITMLEDPNTMSLVQMMISLAHTLKLQVVAEGVDAEPQAAILRLLRCDQMQGYLVGKPMPSDQLAALLEDNMSKHTSPCRLTG